MNVLPPSNTIGGYLVNRLYELGLRHAFGVPGDYVLNFYKLVEDSPIDVVGTSGELGAGYAADAYARMTGLGCCLVTFGVGALSLANAIACAYAEKSPVVLISGAAGLRERQRGQLLHHTFGDFDAQRRVFTNLTCAHCVLDDPLTAFREIDRVLAACLRYKRPVYIELPRDRVAQANLHPHTPIVDEPVSDPEELRESVTEVVSLLRESKRPVILAGIEVERFGLAEDLLRFAERSNISVTAMLLSKSIFPEDHPLYAGVYQAALGHPGVTRFVEQSDCVLMAGAMMTDIDTGLFTQDLDEAHVIHATSEGVWVRRALYPDVRLPDFLRALGKCELPRFDYHLPPGSGPIYPAWRAEKGKALSVARLFQKINSILTPETIVVADPGDALFGAADLVGPGRGGFLSPAFYATLGWAVPGAIEAQVAAPHRRPLILVGDGAFQMSGMELSTAVRRGLDPVVIVLNNRGYLTERVLLEGAFNDVANWNVHRLPEVFGGGKGYEAQTEDELDAALDAALADRSGMSILNVHLPQRDTSPALRRLGEKVGPRLGRN